MSARFTYVSPAGTLVRDGRPRPRRRRRLLRELRRHRHPGDPADHQRAARQRRQALGPRRPLRHPHQQRPRRSQVRQRLPAHRPDNPNIKPRQFLNEALSPLWSPPAHPRRPRLLRPRKRRLGSRPLLLPRTSASAAAPPTPRSAGFSPRAPASAWRPSSPSSSASRHNEPVFDNPENLIKIDARLARAPGSPHKGSRPAGCRPYPAKATSTTPRGDIKK